MDAKHAKHTEPRKKNRRQAAIMLGIGAAAVAVIYAASDRTDTEPPPTDQTQQAEEAFNRGWDALTLGEQNRMCVAYRTLPAEDTIDSLMAELEGVDPEQYDDVRQVYITRFNEECAE